MKIGETIYLDAQATNPVDSRVLAEMMPYFRENFGNPHSSDHIIGWEASKAIDSAAWKVGKLISADSDEIIFTSGATEANNLGLLGLAKRGIGGSRQKILVSEIEHKSILAICEVLENQLGFEVVSVPVDQEGFIDIQKLEELVNEDVYIVSIMAVNNEIGTIQDIQVISRIVGDAGAFFHCDAAQAPLAMDMQEFSNFVDLLSLSGHKICGPQGIGALYIRRDIKDKIEPIIYGGGQQGTLRSGTLPVPLCIGMGSAVKHLSLPNELEYGELLTRRNKFIKRLMQLPWEIKLNGPKGEKRHPGNINICFKGFNAHEIINSLQPHIAASTGSACTTGFFEPSHVLAAIGLSREDAESSIRFSFGYLTSDQDIEEALKLIEKILSKLYRSN